MIRCPVCLCWLQKREPSKPWCVRCEGFKRLYTATAIDARIEFDAPQEAVEEFKDLLRAAGIEFLVRRK
jgi:hypothetical protein